MRAINATCGEVKRGAQCAPLELYSPVLRKIEKHRLLNITRTEGLTTSRLIMLGYPPPIKSSLMS